MKNLAVFSLSCFLLFFAGVSGWAQAVLVPDCEKSLYSQQEQLHCLNQALKTQADRNNYLGDIVDLEDKLKETEHRLFTAEIKIETLEDRLNKAEERIEMLEFSPRRMTPKPKAAASKPTPDANKTKSAADKPQPAVDAGKNP